MLDTVRLWKRNQMAAQVEDPQAGRRLRSSGCWLVRLRDRCAHRRHPACRTEAYEPAAHLFPTSRHRVAFRPGCGPCSLGLRPEMAYQQAMTPFLKEKAAKRQETRGRFVREIVFGHAAQSPRNRRWVRARLSQFAFRGRTIFQPRSTDLDAIARARASRGGCSRCRIGHRKSRTYCDPVGAPYCSRSRSIRRRHGRVFLR